MEQIKPDKRYIIAQPEDLNLNLSLKTNFNDLNEFNNTKVISLVDLFNKERNESKKYRIYGNINYFSFLRSKKTEPNTITDLFNDNYLTDGFNFEDFFDIKLFRLTTLQSYFSGTNNYIEVLSAVTNSYDYKLNFFSYGKNIYNEKIYNFKFNSVDIDPYELKKIDNDLIYDNNVYLGFIPKTNSNYQFYEKIIDSDIIKEIHSATTYGYVETSYTANRVQILGNIRRIPTTTNFFAFLDYPNSLFENKLKNFLKVYNFEITIDNINLNMRFIRNYLNIGNADYRKKIELDVTQDTFLGNFINFDKETYSFNEIQNKEYGIVVTMVDNYTGLPQNFNNYVSENYPNYNKSISTANNIYTVSIDFSFKFNPFYKIELRKYESIANEIYSGLSSTQIPPRTAVVVDNKIIWKDLLEYGDPDNYDNPFINHNHYFFNDINFYLKPDLSDKNTAILMNEFTVNFANNDFKFNRNNINLVPQTKKEIC